MTEFGVLEEMLKKSDSKNNTVSPTKKQKKNTGNGIFFLHCQLKMALK